MTLELKTYPEPCLRIKAKPVEDFNADLSEILQEMADMMRSSDGVGLAATQVGLGASIFIVDIGEGLMTFINPEITETSDRKSGMEEGCLSLPDITVNVVRPEQIKVKANDEHGEAFIKVYGGLLAKVLQHEIDHLSGKLLIDYLDPFRYFMVTRRLVGAKRKGTVQRGATFAGAPILCKGQSKG